MLAVIPYLIKIIYAFISYLRERELMSAGEEKAINDALIQVNKRVEIVRNNIANIDGVSDDILRGGKGDAAGKGDSNK